MKKLLSVFAVFALILSFCSCGSEIKSNSSANAESKKMSSQSATVSENESVNSENKQSSSKKEDVSSKIEKTSQKRETSSINEESSQNEDSSQKGVLRPSQTESESVVVAVKDTVGVGAFHFSPYWTYNYGNDKAKRYEEFEDVIKSGYFNTIIVNRSVFTDAEMWDICAQYGVTVWMDMWSYYDSKSGKQTLEEYLKGIEDQLELIKPYGQWWNLFQGFHYEETVWRGQKNEDYRAVTKALYQKYGKRNFAVFALGEFEENHKYPDMTLEFANEKKIMHPSSFDFLTDVSFDSYGADVRDEAPLMSSDKFPEIYDGKSYYRVYTDVMKNATGHDANIWYFPTAFAVKSAGITIGDEGFCLGHLNFFDNLLMEQEHRGGLMLYTYQQFDEDDYGLQSRLVLKDEEGNQKLRPDEEKWKRYSVRLKEITEEYKKLNGNILRTL